MISASNLQSASEGGAQGGERRWPDAPFDEATLATPVLIVDDEAMIAWMIESVFEFFGFATIEIAATGEEAMERAGAMAPGLVVSDINLGAGMDGIAAAVHIREATLAPVIFVTGYANDAAVARVRAEIPGAPVLRKPIQIDELRAAVVRALADRTRQ